MPRRLSFRRPAQTTPEDSSNSRSSVLQIAQLFIGVHVALYVAAKSFMLFAYRAQEDFWRDALRALAAHFGVDAQVTMERTRLDGHWQWFRRATSGKTPRSAPRRTSEGG